MSRAFLLVMDSVGIGATPDADRFGDAGADTLGHIAERVPLHLPALSRLGLGSAAELATGRLPPGLGRGDARAAVWGAALEVSRGKDTPTGHWEIAGCPVDFDWGYFPPGPPSFPVELTDALIAQGHLPGLLGNCAASGTEIIAVLGAEHLATGKPIVYTSGDSVLQIAAHEVSFGLDRLLELCGLARRLVDRYRIGRVIARPFIGSPGSFRRTANRHDYAVPPPGDTLLDRLVAAGGSVIAIGKIDDIFAHRGISRAVKGDGNAALFDATLAAAAAAPDGALVFANFVDFDTNFGHRRDVAGYAACLEAFDARLGTFEAVLQPGDLAVITADHGCDPTWPGTDHTREHVPVLGFGPGVSGGSIGLRHGFSDIGQTVARHLGLPPLDHGTAFIG
jgi:phosphopentomutase